MVETSYIELCFVLPVFLQNLHNCFFLSMLLIPYYTTVFRGQSQNRWYKTAMSAAMLLNMLLNLMASDIPFSTSRMHYSFVTLKACAFCFFVWRCQSNLPCSAEFKRSQFTLTSLIGPVFSLITSQAPFHTWRIIYENASVCFCPKMPRTNVHCLTPSPHKRPVDVTRGKIEYVDSPLATVPQSRAIIKRDTSWKT